MTYVILLGIAAAIAFVPAVWKSRPAAVFPPIPFKPAGPTYQSAIADLANVRLRLLQTELLNDQAKAALDTLTLSLVAGSDK